MHWVLLWTAWASINLAATIAPGPAFAMTVKTAIAHDRRTGIFLSLGLGLGVGALMVLVTCGLAVLIATSALAFELLKFAGAAYLVYLGIMALCSRKKNTQDTQAPVAKSAKIMSDAQALRTGFLTNLLNPKGMVFFSAMSTQFMSGHTPWQMIILYVLTAMVIESGWFSFVT